MACADLGATLEWLVDRYEFQLDARNIEVKLSLPPARAHVAIDARVLRQLGEDGISSGLGLSLAKQIVVKAGGQLWYEDREGGGACFIIELPEASEPAHA